MIISLIADWNEIKQTGIVYNEKQFDLEIKCFSCDAPARSFLKNIISHTGYNSCERCCIHGTYEGRVVFNEDTEFPARQNDIFRQCGYDDHQRGCESPLVNAGVDCVTSFVLDYMHLVCLGVVRRMLNYIKKGPGAKISANQVGEISNLLVSFSGCMPSEFARQPRSLQELDRWKATEFRQFLLYTGPVALRGIVSKELYEHFISLSISMSIMLQLDDHLRMHHLPYAGDLIRHFVYNCKHIYGNTFTVYNVHNLLHLYDDCVNHNCSLNDFSCFPFENFLQRLKKSVRNSSHPTAQVCKRQFEYQRCFGKLPKKALFTKVSTNRKDNCFLLTDSSIAFVKVKHNDGTFGCDVVHPNYLDNLYATPVASTRFDVSLLRNRNRDKHVRRNFKMDDFYKKCVCLPERRGLAIFPLLHEVER